MTSHVSTKEKASGGNPRLEVKPTNTTSEEIDNMTLRQSADIAPQLAPALVEVDLSNVWIDTAYTPDSETNSASDGYASRSFDAPSVPTRGDELTVSLVETVESGGPVETDLYIEHTLLDPDRLLDLTLNPLIALHKSGHSGDQFPGEQEPDAEYALNVCDIPGQCGTAAIVNALRCLESDGLQHRDIEVAVRAGAVVHGSLLSVDQARQFAEAVLEAVAAHEADATRQEEKAND